MLKRKGFTMNKAELRKVAVQPKIIKGVLTHQQAVSRGRAGGKVGGPARARALTPRRRSEIAAMGARAANAKD